MASSMEEVDEVAFVDVSQEPPSRYAKVLYHDAATNGIDEFLYEVGDLQTRVFQRRQW